MIEYNFETNKLICNANIKEVEKFIKGFKMTWETFKLRMTFWGNERGLYKEGTIEGQIEKLKEEAQEIEDAYTSETVGDLMLEIGDAYAVLHNLCFMLGVEPEECMELTWGKIKDRKGKMRNGTFIKESDLTKEEKYND